MSAPVSPPHFDALAVAPEAAAVVGACLVLLTKAAGAKTLGTPARRAVAGVLALAASAASTALGAAAVVSTRAGRGGLSAGSMVAHDAYGASFKVVLGGVAALALVMGHAGLGRDRAWKEEFSSLVLLATAGMMVMVSAVDLIVIFLALELFSVSFYVLAGFLRDRPAPQEAALKYFLLGSFASAFFLYGIALTYGGTGSLNFQAISSVVSRGDFSWLVLGGTALLLAGLAFKVGAVPFHMWVPDVYQGTPSYLVGFLAAGAKIAGFGAALRIFAALLPGRQTWLPLVIVAGVVTMVVGAMGAMGQTNVKRILAYSSIVHAGYLFLGVAAPHGSGVGATLFYLTTYTAMIIGAFAVVAALQKDRPEAGSLDDFRGLGRTRPLLGVALTVLLLGLAGVPPTSGFIAKFYLFRSAVEAGLWGFALAGALASVVAAFFYIRLIVVMYQGVEAPVAATSYEPEGLDLEATSPAALYGAIAVTVLVTVLVGVFPQPVLAFSEAARLLGGI